MALLGSAAMVLSFDIDPAAADEHDDWHSREHLPERLAIPGFLRGSRWAALDGSPRYLVLYEVAELATLSSPGYLERLNNPSPWTARMMPHYRGMKRGLCTVAGSFGVGTGHFTQLLRFKPAEASAASLRQWLVEDALPRLVLARHAGSAHLLESAATAAMTNEQRIRGADAGLDWAVLLTGYKEEALAGALAPARLEERGATGVTGGLYRFDYSLGG